MAVSQKNYRLALDLGTNSIGWSALILNKDGNAEGILDSGVRVFSDGRDPKSRSPLAVDRRLARGARRRRDRYLLRRRDLMDVLVDAGLMPKDRPERKALEKLDPYELRAKALNEKVTLHELGRALFHLNQRRGFKSNRKADAGDDKEKGKIRVGAEALEKAMKETGARTLGEFLYSRHKNKETVRARMTGSGTKAGYDFYPQRWMLEEEFDLLWAEQKKHHPKQLSDALHDKIKDIIFYQRPLRPQQPGKCALDPAKDKDDIGGVRAPWALPRAQQFRVYQELANLRIIDPSTFKEKALDFKEREALAEELLSKGKKTVGFNPMRKKLGLEADVEFNLESAKRTNLLGDQTAFQMSKKDRFGKKWQKLSHDQRTEVIEKLLTEADENEVVRWLMETHGLNEENALAVSDFDASGMGYCRVGRRALEKIVPIIRDQGLTYYDAAIEAGYDPSERKADGSLDQLPYYGETLQDHLFGTNDSKSHIEDRYGKIPNPTVHIGLNQIRRVINSVIKAYGKPTEIVIELARDLKMSRQKREEIEKLQSENQKRNDERRKKLEEQKVPVNYENMLRLRLWEELNPADAMDRRCPYSGERISLQKLFSADVEIEHILPFSRTLDDSPANKTVSFVKANRIKGNASPYEAFSTDDKAWEDILERAAGLPKNKSWRFAPDAMERFDKESGFISRQLNDTAYLARITKRYLSHVCPPNNVWVTPGRLTELLRRKWNLNTLLSDHNLKNRYDHRHHAIDAIVVGVSDRRLLQRISRENENDRERVDVVEPWDGFRDDVAKSLQNITVSHRPDHGIRGRLHEETAYGVIRNPEDWDGHNLVYRKALVSLNENEIGRIRDPKLRQRVEEYVFEAKRDGEKLEDALAGFEKEHGVRRLRLLKKEKDMIEISDGDGRAYKAFSPGRNHHVDIIALPDGKWIGWGVTFFDVNQQAAAKGAPPPWKEHHPAARLVMRVHNDDVLKYESGGEEAVMRVVRLNPSAGRFYMAPPRESGKFQERHNDKEDHFRWEFLSFGSMKEKRARKVHIDALGRVSDPGFRP